MAGCVRPGTEEENEHMTDSTALGMMTLFEFPQPLLRDGANLLC